MKIVILFIQLLFLSSPMLGQNPFSQMAGQETLAIRNKVWARNPISGKFEPLKNHPPYVVPPSVGRGSGAAWDSEFLYLVELKSGKNIQIRYAFTLNSPEGPHWFWHEPVSLVGDFRFLAACNRRVLLQQEGIINDQNVLLSRLILWDLEEGSTKIILERENPHKTLLASAALKDHNFIIMFNEGSIFQLEEGASVLRELKSNFWPEISERYTHLRKGPKGETIYLPPHFRSTPFFDTSGNLYFALQVREINHWDRKAITAMWQDLTASEQESAIAHGMWPPKEEGVEGSEDVAVILKFDAENKLTKVPESEYKSFIEQDKYTHQWRWSVALGFSSIGLDRLGHFVTVESLLADVSEQALQSMDKPTSDRKAAPAVLATEGKPPVRQAAAPTR